MERSITPRCYQALALEDELVDDPAQGVEVVDDLDAARVRLVVAHGAVAEHPRRWLLGVQPQHVLGPRPNPPERPGLRGEVVVAAVADDDDGGAGGHRLEVAIDELAQGAAVVAVGVDVDDLATERSLD